MMIFKQHCCRWASRLRSAEEQVASSILGLGPTINGNAVTRHSADTQHTFVSGCVSRAFHLGLGGMVAWWLKNLGNPPVRLPHMFTAL